MEKGAKMERLGMWSLAVAAVVGIVVLMLAFSASAAESAYMEGAWFIGVDIEMADGTKMTANGICMLTQNTFSDSVSGTILSVIPSFPVETPAGVFMADRTGLGVWQRVGENEYLANEIHQVPDEQGFPVGTMIVSMRITLIDPNTSKFTYQSHFYDLEGNKIYLYGYAAGVGRKLELKE
jgi:uncharacterized membrane protein